VAVVVEIQEDFEHLPAAYVSLVVYQRFELNIVLVCLLGSKPFLHSKAEIAQLKSKAL